MAVQRTTRAGLTYPGAVGDRDWHQPLIAQALRLDALGPVGAGCVSPAAVGAGPGFAPSGLAVRVAACAVRDAAGNLASCAGSSSYGVTPSATTRVWAGPDGALGSGADWPSSPHARLASVTADADDVTAIVDERGALGLSGPAVAALAADATLAAWHGLVTVDATADPVTLTLPPAGDAPGQVVRVKKIDASANAVTIEPDGAEEIDGDADRELAAQWDGLTLVSDGTRWLAFGA